MLTVKTSTPEIFIIKLIITSWIEGENKARFHKFIQKALISSFFHKSLDMLHDFISTMETKDNSPK